MGNIKCTLCGFELPPQEYLNHRRNECPGPGNENIVRALDRVALELEIQNLFNHGTLEQIAEAESRRAALFVSRKG